MEVMITPTPNASLLLYHLTTLLRYWIACGMVFRMRPCLHAPHATCHMPHATCLHAPLPRCDSCDLASMCRMRALASRAQEDLKQLEEHILRLGSKMELRKKQMLLLLHLVEELSMRERERERERQRRETERQRERGRSCLES
jgi:hypothetical protein